MGLRGESFARKDVVVSDVTVEEGSRINSFTFSGNLTLGPLTFIPEMRVDVSGDDSMFFNQDGQAACRASQLLLAAVYAF